MRNVPVEAGELQRIWKGTNPDHAVDWDALFSKFVALLGPAANGSAGTSQFWLYPL
jgi:hypothetical protein